MNKLSYGESITFRCGHDTFAVINHYEFNTIVDLIEVYRYKLDVVRIVHNLRKGLSAGHSLLYHKYMVEAVADYIGYQWRRYGE